MLRARLNDELKSAMKAKDQRAVSTVRLILAALKDRDIAARTKGNTDGIAFLIYERATQRPIGIAQHQDIDQRNRTAEYVVAISEADARDKGYGTEVTRLMLAHAFNALGMHSIYLSVFEFNPAGKRAYEKAGFRVCGRRRAAIYLDGRHWDEFIMECLASEFGARAGEG